MKKGIICNEGFELLREGSSDQANLLSPDQLGELFGGYCNPLYCGKMYENNQDNVKCPKRYCPGKYTRF